MVFCLFLVVGVCSLIWVCMWIWMVIVSVMVIWV